MTDDVWDYMFARNMRLAIADAGDGIEDAGFEETVANRGILKLYELRKWCEDVIGNAHSVNSVEKHVGEKRFWDQLFENQMNTLTRQRRIMLGKHYLTSPRDHIFLSHYSTRYQFKSALKSSFYELISARDTYREAMKGAGVGMHRDLFPEARPSNSVLTSIQTYIIRTTSEFTSAEHVQAKKLAKGKDVVFDPRKPWKATIFFARTFPAWQEEYIKWTWEVIEQLGRLDIKTISAMIEKNDLNKAMPFIHDLKKRLDAGESKAELTRTSLPFQELVDIDIVAVDENNDFIPRGNGVPRLALLAAVPGRPSFISLTSEGEARLS
ncbi:cytosolic leucyl tRNA synthetase [Aspergillus hancockii]|nr:cytosolic leucyl tRNA synthetase [Aspergillus hancockii]